MARLYADENFPLPIVEKLRRLGHDVLTTYEAGNAGQSMPDEAVLAFARADSRTLLSLNRKHFIHLHGAQPEHASIIVCKFDPDFISQAGRIHAVIGSHAQLSGQIIRINRPTS